METFLGLNAPIVPGEIQDKVAKDCFSSITRTISDMLNKSKKFRGSTVTVTLVTDIRTDSGQLQKKSRTFIFRDGMIMDLCNESDWVNAGAV